MTRQQKKTLFRIISAAALTITFLFLPLHGLWEPILFLIPYLIIGYDVLGKAFLGVLNREIFDENFLMSAATIGAMALGSYGEGVEVMLFYQIGELFQSYAVGKSRRSITALMDIRPDYANIERNGSLVQVDPETVSAGDVILVQPGEKVPLDGIVIQGSSTLNTSPLTGESLPREIAPGEEIISGCVNITGLLKIKVTKPFEESTVSKILDLVENSSLKKAKAEHFITKFAHYYTPAVCGAALILAVVPPLLMGEWSTWIQRALTFLVISCPCALVISIPLTFFGGIGGASRVGILIKGGNYLEALSHTKTAVFDKTGTLTKGLFSVSQVFPAPGFSRETLLEKAALAESYSSHPISHGLKEAAGSPENTGRVSQVKEIPGSGVTAFVDGCLVAAGNAALMRSLSVDYSEIHGFGTVVYVAFDGVFAGGILISDQIKETSQNAIKALKAQGVKTVMLTGDIDAAARAVGERLGMDRIFSQLLPADKVACLEQLLKEKPKGSTLAFVGDGINDAPVLSRADIGIAMGAMGSDAAIEAADIVLMDDDPEKIPLAMKISRKCLRIVRENIVLALGVKSVCLILGALGIAGMQAAIFADVGVMILAVLNAARMLRISH